MPADFLRIYYQHHNLTEEMTVLTMASNRAESHCGGLDFPSWMFRNSSCCTQHSMLGIQIIF